MHPNQISNWKKHLSFRRVTEDSFRRLGSPSGWTEEQILENGKTVFQSNGKHELQTTQESELYEQIGRLKMELECLCFGYRVALELKKICHFQLMTNVESTFIPLSVENRLKILTIHF